MLTPEQEQRLAELEQKGGSQSQAPTLSSEQEQRLAELESKGLQSSTQTQQSPDINTQIDDTFNKFNQFSQEYQQNARLGRFNSASGEQLRQGYENSINSLRGQLNKLGLDNETIKRAQDVHSKIKAPRYGSLIGGTAGGVAGPAIAATLGVSNPIGLVGAAVVGAGALGTAGEAVQTGLEEKRLIGSDEAMKSFLDNAKWEAGGRGAGKAVRWATKGLPLVGIKQPIPETQDLIKEYAKVGGVFTPSEMDKRYAISALEGYSRGAIGAKRVWQNIEQKEGIAAKAFADKIIDSIADKTVMATPTEIGKTLSEGISKGGSIYKNFDDMTRPLYEEVDRLANNDVVKIFKTIEEPTGLMDSAGKPLMRQKQVKVDTVMTGGTVPTNTLKSFAEEILDKDKRMGGEFLSSSGRERVNAVFKLPEQMGFADARDYRSGLLADVRNMGREKDKSEAVIAKLADLADETIFNPTTAKNLPPEAQTLLRNANSLYRQGMETLKTTFSEKLLDKLEKNPSNAISEIFPKNNPTAIKEMRDNLINPFGGQESPQGRVIWNRLRQQWLTNTVEKSFKDGAVKKDAFQKALKDIGEEGIKEMFPDATSYEGVKNIDKLFNIVSKQAPSEASLFVKGSQIAGGASIYQGAKSGNYIKMLTGGITAIGPYTFARLSESPLGVKLLTAGFKAKKGTSEIGPIVARMAEYMKEVEEKDRWLQNRAEILHGEQAKNKQLMDTYGQGVSPTMAEREQQMAVGY